MVLAASEKNLPYIRKSGEAAISGRIKSTPDDFVVEEITLSGKVLELGRVYSKDILGINESQDLSGKEAFTVFVMQKRGWNTVQALRSIAEACGRGIRSVGFAGTKDRIALSTQLCSIYGAEPEAVAGVRIKDISVNGAWKSDKGVKLGDLLGNRFTVTIRDISGFDQIEKINRSLGGTFPNYYGLQRFGYRFNNVSIGVHMLKGEFKEAVMTYLTDSSNETNEENIAARQRLSKEWDFAEALFYFPKSMKYERSMLGHLSRSHDDYAGAIRSLPRQVQLMFVHAVESYVFNASLAKRVESKEFTPREGELVCSSNALGFPNLSSVQRYNGKQGGESNTDGELFVLGNVIGYDTPDSAISAYEKEVLEQLGITPYSFKVRKLPGIASKGTLRPLFAPYTNFAAVQEAEDTARLRFSLPSGSYATVLLNEFINSSKQ